MPYRAILAVSRQYGLIGVCEADKFQGDDHPYPCGWKELHDAGLEFEQVEALFPARKPLRDMVRRFVDPVQDYMVPDTAEEAVKDRAITVLRYFEGFFRRYFTSPYEQYARYVGQPFTVLGSSPDEVLEGEDATGPMYQIKFSDGAVITAWGHEVCLLDRPRCHGRTYEERSPAEAR